MGDVVQTEAVIAASGSVGTSAPVEQRYELRITAVGEVRDKDGNLISAEPVEATAVLTEDELKAHMEAAECYPPTDS